MEERRGRRCRSLRGGGRQRRRICSSIYRYGTITRLGAIGKKGPHLFPHLLRNKSTNAHSTNESATKETVKRVLYTFPVKEEDVRDGDSFDVYVALEPNEIIPNAVRSLEEQRNRAFEAGNVRIGKSYAREMSDKGYSGIGRLRGLGVGSGKIQIPSTMGLQMQKLKAGAMGLQMQKSKAV